MEVSTTLSTLSKRARLLSFFEFVLGTFIVIGHNVLRLLPNEVPILFILGWISLRLRDGGWAAAGFRRPHSWWLTIGGACVAAAVLQLGGELVIGPLIAQIWPEPQSVSQLFQPETMNWKQAFVTLLVIWTFAAFGEEMSYRGYLLTRAADVGARSPAAWWLAMVIVAIPFGFGHYYKGPAGVADSTWSGLVLGSAYLLSGRNLWTPILAHGISDTVAVMLVFTGIAS
jgi:membrane protease YdiL (CAAX protease family)